MKQTALQNMDVGLLPDGTEIKAGDLIMYDYGPYSGQLTRVVLYDGKLCMEENFMFGDNEPIDHFLKQTYSSIRKIKLTDIYKHCKKNKWDTAEYILKFGAK